jgi:hypothetical protein
LEAFTFGGKTYDCVNDADRPTDWPAEYVGAFREGG